MIVEGTHAQGIAGQQEATGPGIPDGQGEVPPDVLYESGAEGFVCGEKESSVGGVVSARPRREGAQGADEVLTIVQPAVEAEDRSALPDQRPRPGR